MNFISFTLLFSIQSSHQYQGDNPISKGVHRDIKCFQDLVKSRDGILSIHDIEEYLNSSYHVHDQYMKGQPHISIVSINIAYDTYMDDTH
jgi:hypothetical protein